MRTLSPRPGALRTLLLVASAGFLMGCPGEVPQEGSPGGEAAGGGDSTDPYANLSLKTVEEGTKPTVGFVTNGIANFWVYAEAGAQKGGEDFDVNVEVRMPPEGPADQKRMLEELLVAGVNGVAVSPIDPDNQLSLLNDVAAATNMTTHDSDAPASDRICYVGMSNYVAGRMCGELVKEAMPDGGSLMIFVGRLEQANSKQRRQGLIDELLDRDDDPTRFDPAEGVLKGEKYTILATQTDGFDFSKAKAQAEDALTANPDLGAMVGLFEYNPPILLEALKGADKLGQVQVIGFDENFATLQAILDGTCAGTIVQDPYNYGYESVRILAGLARGDESVLPAGGFLDLPARTIRKDNAQEFWDQLKPLLPDGAVE